MIFSPTLEASAAGEAAPLAIMVTPWPAAVVVVAARRPAGLRVAESMLTLLDELDATAGWAPGGAEPPATTVTADACICKVVAEELSAPNENDGAAGALIGNEPAGHKHRQLHPPLLAACSADVAFPLPPEPATTVTAAPAAEVVVVAMRPSFVRDAVLIDDAADNEPLAEPEPARMLAALPFTVAVAFDPPPPPATTVTEPAVAAFAVAPLDELLLCPVPACTVTVAAEAFALDELPADLLVKVTFPPDPARTVTAAAFEALAEADALLPVEALLVFDDEVPLPPDP